MSVFTKKLQYYFPRSAYICYPNFPKIEISRDKILIGEKYSISVDSILSVFYHNPLLPDGKLFLFEGEFQIKTTDGLICFGGNSSELQKFLDENFELVSQARNKIYGVSKRWAKKDYKYQQVSIKDAFDAWEFKHMTKKVF